MDSWKIVRDLVVYVGFFYVLDAVYKFVSDYNETKDRVEVLEAAEVARAVYQPLTADDVKKARANGVSSNRGRRLQPVKDEPADAVPE